MQTYFLDTETTGLSAEADRVVELAIVDQSGQIVFDSLINPGRTIPFAASRVHGISDFMVATAPRFEDVWDDVLRTLSGNRVVIYNASFDKRFFPDQLRCAGEVRCAMLEFAAFHRARYGSNKRKFRLVDAAAMAGHQWHGDQHRALADTLACRSVWFHLNGWPTPPVVKVPPRKHSQRSTYRRADVEAFDTTPAAPVKPPNQVQKPAPSASAKDKAGSPGDELLYLIIALFFLALLIFGR